MILKVKGWKTYISGNDNHSLLPSKPHTIKYLNLVVLNTWLHIGITGETSKLPTPMSHTRGCDYLIGVWGGGLGFGSFKKIPGEFYYADKFGNHSPNQRIITPTAHYRHLGGSLKNPRSLSHISGSIKSEYLGLGTKPQEPGTFF